MDMALVLIAAFGAGLLNTVAGGGTFLTFPALVFIGVPPVIANATSAIAVFPGYLGGALGFRQELATWDRGQAIRLLITTMIGSVIGSLLLLITPNQTFSALVPFLLLAATLVFLCGDQIRAWARKYSHDVTPYGWQGMLIVSIYGGYFNGGLGIVLLALFALWGMQQIHLMNGLKNGLSFALSAVSVVIFTLGGLIMWKYAIGMMIAATLGGYAGAPVARMLPKSVLRIVVATVGFAMSALFFARLWA